MAELFSFELISPERRVLAADVQQVLIPGAEGDFCVLPGHARVMSLIRPGILEVTTHAGKLKKYYIRGHFAEVEPKNLMVLAQQCINVDELDKNHLLQEIRNLEEDVADAADEEQRTKAQFALDRLKELKNALEL